MSVRREVCCFWRQAQIEIGDVKGKDAMGRKFSFVQRQGLSREQMHGDGIAAKSVECDEVILRVGRLAETNSREEHPGDHGLKEKEQACTEEQGESEG
jgi:hypothetical protein